MSQRYSQTGRLACSSHSVSRAAPGKTTKLPAVSYDNIRRVLRAANRPTDRPTDRRAGLNARSPARPPARSLALPLSRPPARRPARRLTHSLTQSSCHHCLSNAILSSRCRTTSFLLLLFGCYFKSTNRFFSRDSRRGRPGAATRGSVTELRWTRMTS